MELKANPNKAGQAAPSSKPAWIAKRGPVARRCWCKKVRLHVGDSVVVGEEMGKIRAMIDDKGRQLTVAPVRRTPVEVLGLSGVSRGPVRS